jgi:uncharacterized protein
MWINRDLNGVLKKIIQDRPVVVLTGARQTGKTSLIKKIFPDYKYVSLDLPSDAQHADIESQSFLKENPSPLIIDEIQYAPSIFRYIKHQVDQSRKQRGQYILTGSQNFLLMKGVTDSLAGRAEFLVLDPLSIREISRSYPELSIDELILRGGYPELYEDIELNPTRFYRAYFSSYLERDIRSILNVFQLRDFERFLRACALRTGQLLNKSEIARDVGISPSTASEWISTLQASHQISLLEPWFSNKTKSIIKSPKLYLCDTGLLLFLLNIKNKAELLNSPLLGQVWETCVFNEIRKKLTLSLESESLYFWNDRAREVDFLIHRGGRFDLIEAKWSEKPTQHDVAGIQHAANIIGENKVSQKIVMCRTRRSFPIIKGFTAAPLTHEL